MAKATRTPLGTLEKVIIPSGNPDDWENAVQDDIDGEEETLPEISAKLIPPSKRTRDDFELDDDNEQAEELRANLRNASKAVTEKTHDEYMRLGKSCVNFLVARGFIRDSDTFFSKTPLADTPYFIAAWIMYKCDEIGIDGNPRPRDEIRDSYSHAEKMRASMTYMFGRQIGLGSLPWHQSEVTGNWNGNPSVSHLVSSYMLSLRRRKARIGDTSTSSRAVTSELIKKVWMFNTGPVGSIATYTAGLRGRSSYDVNTWGGGRARRMLHCAYTLSYLCLLRFDEVLKIRFQDLEFISPDCVKLTLPFRKTSPCGDGIKPFYLFTFDEQEAHLCPIRALANWIGASRLNRGYLFRRIWSGDRVGDDDKPMASDTFLEMFRNNLLDVGVDPVPYGTHSFRRGGCQYFASERRWPIRRLCDYGGWSMEFTNLTIVKYLLSWNDDPTERREDFLNPACAPTVKCRQCGRTCRCS